MVEPRGESLGVEMMTKWDFEAIAKRMEQDRKEKAARSERERQEMIERTKLAREALDAIGSGGPDELRRWALERGVDLSRPKARPESFAAGSLSALRLALGLGKSEPKGLSKKSKIAIEATVRIAMDDYLKKSKNAAIEEKARLELRLEGLKRARASASSAAQNSPAPAPVPKAEADGEAQASSRPQRRILGGRSGGAR